MTGPMDASPSTGTSAGPVILVRPDRNETDAAALRSVGLTVRVEPYLRVTTANDPAPALAMLDLLDPRRSGRGTWLVLTSARTMAHWAALVGADRLYAALRTARAGGLRVACVGSATAATLPDGLSPAITATKPDASTLLGDLLAATEAPEDPRADAGIAPGATGAAYGMLALLPGSGIARATLPEGLVGAGWAVRSAAVYDTRPVPTRPASADLLANGTAAALILRSPSAVAAVARFVTPAPSVAILTVGPTTTSAARERGWSSITPASPDPRDVARALTHALTGDR